MMQTLPRTEAEFSERLRLFTPKTHIGELIRAVCSNSAVSQSLREDLLETIKFTIVPETQLSVVIFRGLEGVPWTHPLDKDYDLDYARSLSHRVGRRIGSYHRLLDPRDPKWKQLIEDHGVTSRKFVTNAGIDYMVSDFAGGSGDISNFHFHGLGTDATAEAATQTALIAELTTEYNPNSTRATGSQVANTGPTPDTFTSVGTNTLDSGTPVVKEHGLFSAASAGTMWDRSLTGDQTLNGANGDSLQTTYVLTLNSGG